jgi:hypothetical protein
MEEDMPILPLSSKELFAKTQPDATSFSPHLKNGANIKKSGGQSRPSQLSAAQDYCQRLLVRYETNNEKIKPLHDVKNEPVTLSLAVTTALAGLLKKYEADTMAMKKDDLNRPYQNSQLESVKSDTDLYKKLLARQYKLYQDVKAMVQAMPHSPYASTVMKILNSMPNRFQRAA